MVVNMYSSASLKQRKKVLDEIRELRKSQQNMVWCVVGDFNSIRRKEERKGLVSVSDYSRETKGFNDFIENFELLDIPMVGRKFTWYKPNGLVKSRIERIFVSKELLDVWLNNKKIVLSRSVSDHCTLVLKVLSMDWGSKSFRSLNVWQRDGRFLEFIRNKWQSCEVLGGGMFVLKEKMKKIKSVL